MTVSPPWSINGIVVKQHQDSSYIIGSNKFVNNDGDNQLIHLDKYNKILLDSTYIDTNSSVGIKDLQFSHIQNHYITTGHYQTRSTNKWDSFVTLFDFKGKLVWEKILGDTTSDNGSRSIKPTFDGGYILAGFWEDSSGYWDANVIKIDSIGNVEWDTTLGDYGRNDVFVWVEQSSDGGFVFGGLFGYLFDKGQGWLVKMDKNRNIILDKKFTVEPVTYVSNFRITTDGGYVFAGKTGEFESVPNNTYILKLNANGDKEWATILKDNSTLWFQSAPNKVLQLTDMSYIIVGSIDTGITYSREVLISKIDTGGVELWRRMYGNIGYNDYGYDFDTCSDGGFIITGRTETSFNSNVIFIKTNCAGFAGPPITKFNISPNEMKVKFENKSDSAVNFKWYFGDGDSLVYDWDKSWLWIRKSPPDTFSHVYADTGTYTITLLAGACGEWDTLRQTITIFRTAIAKNEMENPPSLIKITPNPMYDVIQVESNANEPIRLNMFDVTGKKLVEFEFGKSVTENKNTFVHKINVSFLPQGIYFYRVKGKAGNSGFGKVVKM